MERAASMARRARRPRRPLEPHPLTAEPPGAKLRDHAGRPEAQLATREPRPAAAATRPARMRARRVTPERRPPKAAARPATMAPLPATAARPPATAARPPATAAPRLVAAAPPLVTAAPRLARQRTLEAPATAAPRLARARNRRATRRAGGVRPLAISRPGTAGRSSRAEYRPAAGTHSMRPVRGAGRKPKDVRRRRSKGRRAARRPRGPTSRSSPASLGICDRGREAVRVAPCSTKGLRRKLRRAPTQAGAYASSSRRRSIFSSARKREPLAAMPMCTMSRRKIIT
jgi:hypothetical protein